jgi:hypothetical protein
MFCFAIYHHHRHDAIMQVEELDEKEIEFS